MQHLEVAKEFEILNGGQRVHKQGTKCHHCMTQLLPHAVCTKLALEVEEQLGYLGRGQQTCYHTVVADIIRSETPEFFNLPTSRMSTFSMLHVLLHHVSATPGTQMRVMWVPFLWLILSHQVNSVLIAMHYPSVSTNPASPF